MIHVDTESVQTKQERGVGWAVEDRILHPAMLDDRITVRRESALGTQAASYSSRPESPNVSIRQECF